MRFKGKVALITGGGTGIGAAVAARIVGDGGQVALLGRRQEPLEAIAGPLGGLALAADAADRVAMEEAVRRTVDRFGRLDILVANAGGHGVGPTLAFSDDDWRLATRLNLDTAFVSARACLPALIDSRGAIVMVASIAGLFAGPDAIGYVTMKHGCIGLARSLARDYGRAGVRTNTVCPGWVETAMADEQMAVLVQQGKAASVAEAYSLVTRDVPLGRPASPDEVASVVCFLASSDAAMVSGAVVTVDGGGTAVDLPTLAFAS